MKEFLIQEYIKKLTSEEIKTFAKKEGITIDDEETNIIYNYIKEYWRTLLHGNPRTILQELKLKLNNDSYAKIEKLYEKFKDRIN